MTLTEKWKMEGLQEGLEKGLREGLEKGNSTHLKS
jgi:hypothetical protein